MDEALISNTTPQSSQDNVIKDKMSLPKSRVQKDFTLFSHVRAIRSLYFFFYLL